MVETANTVILHATVWQLIPFPQASSGLRHIGEHLVLLYHSPTF